MSSDDEEALAALLDALIPGDAARWPSFTAAVPAKAFVQGLGEQERDWLADAREACRDLAGREVIAAVSAWEQNAPQAFSTVLSAVHKAYYTAPCVLAVVATLADSGPREPSRTFDPDLVAQVLATAPGRRRL